MPDHIDVAAWKADGRALWQHIQERGELAFAWNNPWLRVTVVGALILAGAATLFFLPWKCWYLSVPVALYAGVFLVNGVKFYVLDKRAGGLHFFYSKEHFGIGGARERIAIPYSSIVVPETVNPSTVNSNYIDLSVPAENCSAITILTREGGSRPWDGKPFKMAIASIRVVDGKLIAKAYPNEFIVRIFSTFYPLLMYLSQDNPEVWRQMRERKKVSP
jgi:hypothetical protein